MQNILILGGTQFCGRLLAESLSQQAGLNITLFHRGQTHPELFPEFQRVHGDRETDDILPLTRRDWDAVIDFCAFYPRSLDRLGQRLTGRVGRYLLISSVSAYAFDEADDGRPITEAHPTLSCSPAEEIDTGWGTYGKRKAACERVLLALPELNARILRPGLIYGPYDPTDRLYYWIWRFARQAEALVPNVLQKRGQWTYARDFAALLETALLGPLPPRPAYHVLTQAPLAYGELLETLAEVCQRQPKLQLRSPDWLEAHDALLWRDLPLFLPIEMLYDLSAVEQDFAPRFTPVADSLADSRRYYADLGWPVPAYGLSAEREAELLKRD